MAHHLNVYGILLVSEIPQRYLQDFFIPFIPFYNLPRSSLGTIEEPSRGEVCYTDENERLAKDS